MEKMFSQWKKQCLKKLDQSKKGSVDQDIEHIVSLINSRAEFFTTSSCSGRVILIDTVRNAGFIRAKTLISFLFSQTDMNETRRVFF